MLKATNTEKLEAMRQTVDEKLHATLEKRLGESFKMVSERLELIHEGLGEMKTLASGVGDLKKVLTNVKTRGVWGEVQLGNLLEQILTREQYEKNVITKRGSQERVEFAIKLPGKKETILLPIDAKFPQEDYQRLVEAYEQGDVKLVEEVGKNLEATIKGEAKDIQKHPPGQFRGLTLSRQSGKQKICWLMSAVIQWPRVSPSKPQNLGFWRRNSKS